MPDDFRAFGRWLRERRHSLDMTQRELADVSGCSIATIRKMEAGLRRPSKQVTELLAASLEVTPEEHAAFMQLARGGVAPTFGPPFGAKLPANSLPPQTTAPTAPDEPPVEPPYTSPGAHKPAAGSRVATGAPPPGSSAQTPTHPSFVVSGPGAVAGLPAFPTSFIGRGKLVDQVRGLLWKVDVRLLTLTGPPGIGKTRLAIQAASGLVDDFTDGVVFVPLASISDSAAVLPEIAQLLGVRNAPGRTLAQIVGEHLQNKNMLLVLDNFEQVPDASLWVSELLKMARRLKVLVTSRTPLHIYGEYELAVPPLEVPARVARTGDVSKLPDSEPSPLAGYEAVELFIRRAQAVQPSFALSAENALSVAEICTGLDGLPLAIELAAGLCKFYSPQALLARLQDRLALLTDGPRDMPVRHRTIRAAIAWSYDLLDSADRSLFCRLGVFVGGFTAEAAAAVCHEQQAADVPSLLASLVDKNLVIRLHNADDPRYMMLQTIREYALDQVEAAGEGPSLRRRHAEYYGNLAREAESHMAGSGTAVWLNKLAAEHDNVRAVLNHLLDSWPSDAELSWLALQMAADMARFWHLRGYFSEGRDWLSRTLGNVDLVSSQATDGQASLRVRALDRAGWLSWAQGDYAAARTFWESGLARNKTLGDKQRAANLLNGLAQLALDRLDYGEAMTLYREGLALAREVEDSPLVARTLNNLANAHRNMTNYVEARRCYEESLSLYRELGDKTSIVGPLNNLGLVSMDIDDYAAARRYLDESLHLCRELDQKQSLAFALSFMGQLEAHEANFQAAARNYSEALCLALEMGYKMVLANCFEWVASMQEALGHPLDAALLWGAGAALRESMNLPFPLPGRPRYERQVASAQAQADPSDFEATWAEGRSAPLGEAVRYAQEVLRSDIS